MPENQKHFTITLDSSALGQLLDGLKIRAESWLKTAEFIESGYADETFVCEECAIPTKRLGSQHITRDSSHR
jgi:hypothetical protein